MKNKGIYQEILSLLERNGCEFRDIENMVASVQSGIPEVEKRIKEARQSSEETYVTRQRYNGETEQYLYKGYDPFSHQVIVCLDQDRSCVCKAIDAAQFIFGTYVFASSKPSVGD